ncbi:amidase domain-containing protein [Kitasatospora sp. NPDC048540]|uniref:amidase domain-containing protein n=1 Tax=unclassified Kitasatospora TaxID=2633591 RepID=UPI000539D3E6|nr:amidase domain-containing protein [Kitasatospora sp. MBT63]
MVEFAALRKADPGQLRTAADGWVELSKEAWQAVNDIHANGIGPLKEDWQDRVGQAAGKKLDEQARILESGADIMRGVAMVVDGWASSTEYAQRALTHAVELAEAYQLEVDDNGGVSTTGEVTGDKLTHMNEVAELITEALREATQADALASAELRKLAGATCETDPGKALDVLQGEASDTQLNMLAGDIPDGKDPALVARWWDSLTPEERKQLELAEPVKLANLNGLPDSVKEDLRGGPDRKWDRVKMVEWVLAHWDDKSGDFDDENNCTNFASEALFQSGVHMKGDWTVEGDAWNRGDDPGWLGLGIVGQQHSHAWGGAQNLHDFMVSNGGKEVPPSEVKPGDLVFLEDDNDLNPDLKPGNIHHTAIVTAVTPDGDIRYSQHNDSRKNVSMDGRSDHEAASEGRQKIKYVRVEPNWY